MKKVVNFKNEIAYIVDLLHIDRFIAELNINQLYNIFYYLHKIYFKGHNKLVLEWYYLNKYGKSKNWRRSESIYKY